MRVSGPPRGEALRPGRGDAAPWSALGLARPFQRRIVRGRRDRVLSGVHVQARPLLRTCSDRNMDDHLEGLFNPGPAGSWPHGHVKCLHGRRKPGPWHPGRWRFTTRPGGPPVRPQPGSSDLTACRGGAHRPGGYALEGVPATPADAGRQLTQPAHTRRTRRGKGGMSTPGAHVRAVDLHPRQTTTMCPLRQLSRSRMGACRAPCPETSTRTGDAFCCVTTTRLPIRLAFRGWV
jgi:hypothetical protein